MAVPLVASGRLSYLDWLRFLVVLSLAPFHAALSYTGMGVVYVYDTPIRTLILAGKDTWNAGPWIMKMFTVFMDNWFMHLLFLVSGAGAALSLKKRTPGAFIGERASRLLWPLLAGILLVIPAQAWIRSLSFGTFTGGLVSFYPRFFNGIYAGPGSTGNFEWGHLWFLVYLFVFSALALPLFSAVGRKGESSRLVSLAGKLAGGAGILLPALWIGILEAVFRPGWPGFQNLVNDWANFTVYLSFFILGFFAVKSAALLEAMERNRHLALGLGMAAFIARLQVYNLIPYAPGWSLVEVLSSALRGVAAWLLVVAVMGYGRRHLNKESAALGAARDLSFPLYVLHFLPLTAVTYLLLGSGLSVWARWSISVAASWLSVAAFTAAARWVPGLRGFLSIRKPAAAIPRR